MLVTYILCGLLFQTLFLVIYSALFFTLAHDDFSMIAPHVPPLGTTTVTE